MKKLILALMAAACMTGSAYAETVASVDVSGLRWLPETEALKVVKVKPGDTVEADALQADMQALFDLGIFSHVGIQSEDKGDGKLALTFELEENPIVSAIEFSDLTIYKHDALRKLIRLKPGMLFNNKVFTEDMKRLQEIFSKDPWGVTLRGMTFKPDNTLVVLCHEPRIKDVKIEGNKYVKSYVISRYVPFKKGDRYRSDVFDAICTRLKQTGLFAAAKIIPLADSNGDVDLVIQVLEQKSAMITASVGYGTDSGMNGGLSYTELNVGGNAQRFDAGFSTNEDDESNYWIVWSDPFMNRRIGSWAVGLYAREDNDLTYRYGRYDVFNYREELFGGYVSLTKWLNNNGRWQYRLTVDRHRSDTDWQNEAVGGYTAAETKEWFDAIAGTGDLNTDVFLLRAELIHSGLDGRVQYPKGHKEIVGVEQAVELFGGTEDFTRYWVEVFGYQPLGHPSKQTGLPITLAGHVKAGWSSGDMPLAERYTLGGSNSLRGYETGDFRGHEMFLGNFELRIPLIKYASLVGFYDIGNAWDKDLGRMDFGDLYDDYGVGLRLGTPMGLVRLDVAFGGDETKWNFSIGELF